MLLVLDRNIWGIDGDFRLSKRDDVIYNISQSAGIKHSSDHSKAHKVIIPIRRRRRRRRRDLIAILWKYTSLRSVIFK